MCLKGILHCQNYQHGNLKTPPVSNFDTMHRRSKDLATFTTSSFGDIRLFFIQLPLDFFNYRLNRLIVVQRVNFTSSISRCKYTTPGTLGRCRRSTPTRNLGLSCYVSLVVILSSYRHWSAPWLLHDLYWIYRALPQPFALLEESGRLSSLTIVHIRCINIYCLMNSMKMNMETLQPGIHQQ